MEGEPLPASVTGIMNNTRYDHAWWGILVEDLDTGEVIYQVNPEKMFSPGSTTKLYTGAAALDVIGADYRFETPVYARGHVDSSGNLNGDLILVASGDLTTGGRTTPDGKIAYTDLDHGDANSLGNAVLTTPDPLSGLNQLAQQVSDAGIKSVSGEVIIDDRFFDKIDPPDSASDYTLTPIVINDNLIDITVKPSQPGREAEVDWRPKTAAYKVEANVITADPDEAAQLEILTGGPGVIKISGQIPAGNGPVVQTYRVENPSSFARSLLIEALEREGVKINAQVRGNNPSDLLPPSMDYSDMERVVLLTSPPFSENLKLILKVSQNMHADSLLPLMAVKEGKRSFWDGLTIERTFLEKAGLDLNSLSISDGRGNSPADFMTPRNTVNLLKYMSSRDDSQVYLDALPILGVDGSLATSISPESPVKGKVQAKTGTTAKYDAVNDRIIVSSKALAGYMTTSEGRRLAFAVYVNNVPVENIEELEQVGNDLGSVCEAIYREN
ncbi:D-alanyl-D-alanine carboxypeptidase [Methanosarcina horonobensis HB-1 = JCM 15518]|uniref:D-alanyl-D-alanine carboxypeptidase n=1 Tax=Methanosarcina horonobensis HB-1 = JCM 15518 TaxID=1434110 RepID=A0A0E3S955_9EURY|nr:D-alanyl-D-alanine carboxypeptidase [Methanosarcina horonobensis HB-1 = JCM 15518]